MKALVVGSLAALITLLGLGVGMGFIASGGGLVLAAFFAIAVGSTVAHFIEPTTSDRNLGAIVLLVLVLVAVVRGEALPRGRERTSC